MRLLRLVPDETKFDFMRFRRISFPASAVLSVLAIAAYFYFGLNFGIDFIGGTLIEVNLYESEITPFCTVSLRGPSGEVLDKLAQAVRTLQTTKS